MDLVAELIPGTISKFTESKSSSHSNNLVHSNHSVQSNNSIHSNNQNGTRAQSGATAIQKPDSNEMPPLSPEAANSDFPPSDALSERRSIATERGTAFSGKEPAKSPAFNPASFNPVSFNPEGVWNSCLAIIRAQLDAQIFAAWIRPLSLVEVNLVQATGDSPEAEDLQKFSVVISAANKFALDHIQRHYSEYIASALATVLSAESLVLTFRVESKKPAPERTAPRSKEADLKKAEEKREADERRSSPQRGVSDESNLNPKYNFSNFVVGSCNQFAHAACLRVSEMPGSNYNPLFIYGGVGLGKTHLANAIGNSTRRQNKKALLVSSEAFVSELIASLRSNRMQQFKEKFRTLDLLIIDDIQFIMGKERTQEEFFHTFNDLYNRRKQIIITSDTVPQELAGVEERLRTRFACGLAVDLQAPDLETRVAILTKKAEAAGVNLSIDIARYIADAINTNVRELEGAFNRLQAFSSLGGRSSEVTLELAQEVVRDFKPRRQVEVTTELIQRLVAERYNVSITDLLGKRRTHNVALARQVAMFLCRKLTTYSYPEIGAYFGGRDHSTVIHSYRSVEERVGKDKDLSAVLEEIQRTICG